MKVPAGFCLMALAASVPAAAQTQAKLAINVRVEQPAYTGMPIWLHVITRDGCLENAQPTFPWYEYLWLRDDGAEVTKDGRSVARTPFVDVDIAHRMRIPGLGPCLGDAFPGPEHDHRFALSGAYIFDQPGHYRVRWTTGQRNFNGDRPLAQSGWFDFDVEPSTPSQRSAWLDAALPKDYLLPELGPQSNIVSDYIPALLAAWTDPRVTHRLIDLACSDMKDVDIAAGTALLYDLREADAAYFADKVAGGCHWRGMSSFMLRHAQSLTRVRTMILHSLAAHFDKPHPEGDELSDAISAMAAVRNHVPAGADGAAANAWADADIVRISHVLTDPHDQDGMNYTQISTGGLVAYLSQANPTPAEHALLRTMATDSMEGLEPFERLMALKDPADLATMGNALIALQGFNVWGNYLTDMDIIAKNFGARAAPMFRDVAARSKQYIIRDQAGFELMSIGQDGGAPILDHAVRSDYWVEQRSALRLLDKLVDTHVPLGTLARYCTGTDRRDPCGAFAIKTPPGKCEPHFVCMVSPVQNRPDHAPPPVRK